MMGVFAGENVGVADIFALHVHAIHVLVIEGNRSANPVAADLYPDFRGLGLESQFFQVVAEAAQ